MACPGLIIWREEDEKKLVQMAGNVMGLDEDWPSLRKHRSIKNRVVGDIRALPFPEGTFDLVTANMVVEHLEKPEGPFSEIRRVLKPGGLFVFHTPNAYGYSTVFARMIPERLKTWLIQLLEGRPPEDVFKTHYRVNTESQIRQVSQRAGLDIDRVRYVASCAKFALILPLALFELFWIMLLLTHPFRSLRTNLLVTLVKPSSAEPITG